VKTADKIKAAREVLKESEFRFEYCSACYNEDESFILIDNEKLEKVTFPKEAMIAIADWVLCLFIDDGECACEPKRHGE
jgi:translation elongation factor P/translation initiation factor 5A